MATMWRNAGLFCVGGVFAGLVGCTAPGDDPLGSSSGGFVEDRVASGAAPSETGRAGQTGSSSAASVVATGCTYTQGYWKTHPEAWPVSSLSLGSVSYSKDELLAIFAQPVQGNGLIALAHQLIAAKLNVAQGAAPAALGTAIADADAMIGALVVPPVGSDELKPGATSNLVNALASFNEGKIGPGHCDEPPPPPPQPYCGDREVNEGETCDDGNNLDGDGCSSTCQLECSEASHPA